MGESEQRSGLDNIEHIVVLMLENRSFDHMLGYLSLEHGRDEVDGLKPGMSNTADGKEYPIAHATATHVPNPNWDPDHSAARPTFRSAAARWTGSPRALRTRSSAATSPTPIRAWSCSYYNGADLPVYDHLSENFCVCDRWHSSVPGATWPNRLYALTGGADGSRDDKPKPPPIYGKQCVHPPSRRGGCQLALVRVRRRHAALRRPRVPDRPPRPLRLRRPAQAAVC